MRHRLKQSLVFTVGCALAWSSASAQGADNRAETAIAREVRHELVTLPYYAVFDNLTAQVDGSAVTLLGQVTRASLKGAAEKAVQQIKGVHRVDNKIDVLPASSGDSMIRLAVYVATYGQSLLSQYATQAIPPVHIIVNHGNVTLEGVVDSQMDKASFFAQASTVPGVISVTDHLKVVHMFN